MLSAADQTIRLHRLAGHRDGLALIRRSLRSSEKTKINGEWKFRPRRLQVYAWQLGVLFLASAVGCMGLGMMFLVWSAVVEEIGNGVGFDEHGKVCTFISIDAKTESDREQVAVIFSATALISAVIFIVGQMSIHGPIPDGGDVEDE